MVRTREDLYRDYVETFGKQSQMIKSIEELNELAVELAKELNKPGTRRQQILGEVVDVVNMVNQVCLIFDYTDEEYNDAEAKLYQKMECKICKNKCHEWYS